MLHNKKVIGIIQALAEGVDPITGEVFPGDSPYQNAEVTRALFHALEAIKEQRPKKEKPLRQGEPWTKEEDQQLTNGFKSEVKVADLAKAHQRSSGAIRSRLKKLGLVKV